MVCYNPITACYNKKSFSKTGKKDIHIVLHESKDDNGKIIKDSKYLLNEKNYPHSQYEYIKIPCRKCVGCRSDNARMWTCRAIDELKIHKESCFITLTYDNNSPLVKDDPYCICDLRYKHFQNFMKRLRKNYPDKQISFLMCGEYGLSDGRAHFHAILYGIDFHEDRELVYVSKGYEHYASPSLVRAWSTYDKSEGTFTPIGYVDLANVDNDCCAYVSQYVLKKLDLDKNYMVDSFDIGFNGESYPIYHVPSQPPFIQSSKRPAIGLRYLQKYGYNDVERGYKYVTNKSHTHTIKYKTPSYYFQKFEEINPERAEIVKKRKVEYAKKQERVNPISRAELARRCLVHLQRIKDTVKRQLTKLRK